jgi:hypothetical protein
MPPGHTRCFADRTPREAECADPMGIIALPLQRGVRGNLKRPGKSPSGPPFRKGDDAIVDQAQAYDEFQNRST